MLLKVIQLQARDTRITEFPDSGAALDLCLPYSHEDKHLARFTGMNLDIRLKHSAPVAADGNGIFALPFGDNDWIGIAVIRPDEFIQVRIVPGNGRADKREEGMARLRVGREVSADDRKRLIDTMIDYSGRVITYSCLSSSK